MGNEAHHPVSHHANNPAQLEMSPAAWSRALRQVTKYFLRTARGVSGVEALGAKSRCGAVWIAPEIIDILATFLLKERRAILLLPTPNSGLTSFARAYIPSSLSKKQGNCRGG